MVKIILIKSPDEWATTKQVCRDELVVYLSFSSHNIYIYIYILFFFQLISLHALLLEGPFHFFFVIIVVFYYVLTLFYTVY